MAGTATGNLSGRKKQLFLCWQLGLFGNRRLGGGNCLASNPLDAVCRLAAGLGPGGRRLGPGGRVRRTPRGGAPEEPVTAEPVPDTPAQIVIEVPSQGGLGYNENGHLVVRAVLHNVGTQTAQPLDLIALVLNDCVLREVPQTCRFVAFGRFPAVGTEGIAPGTSLPITFDFGPVPDVDLSRSFILWHSVQ